MQKNGKLQEMYDVGQKAIDELNKSDKVDKTLIAKMQEFQDTRFKQLLNAKDEFETVLDREDDTYKKIKEVVQKGMYDQMKDDIPKIEKATQTFKKLLTDAGYHKVYLYWLDDHTMGILEDDFTRSIKDLKKFVKDNDFTEFDYKLIKQSQIPEITLKYELWARNNPTPEQEKNYKKLDDTIMKDRENLKIKHKVVFDFS